MSEIEITIRPYKEEDLEAVSDLINSIQKAEFDITFNQNAQLGLPDINSYRDHGSSGFWVALVSDRIVGTIALLDITGEAAALQKMFVAVHCRGRVSGVSSKLLAHFFCEAQARGIREIYLGTRGSFSAAHRFYERHGFIRFSKTDLPSRFPIIPQDTRFYHLSI